jgi:hypothetical protein
MLNPTSICRSLLGSKPTTINSCRLHCKTGHIDTKGGHTTFVARDEKDSVAWFDRIFPLAKREITLVPGKAFVAETSCKDGKLYTPVLDVAITRQNDEETNNRSLVVWQEETGLENGARRMAYFDGSFTRVPSDVWHCRQGVLEETSSLKFKGSLRGRPRDSAKKCTQHQYNLTDKKTQIVDIPGAEVAWYDGEQLRWVTQDTVNPSTVSCMALCK